MIHDRTFTRPGEPLQKSTPVATMRMLNAFLREVRVLVIGLPMTAYAITTLWEHFGH